MGNRIKIGVLIFTNKLKERGKKGFFDEKKYYGFRSILNEIDRNQFEIEYISAKNISKYNYVLVSITSYYDILNLQSENIEKKDAKIVAGGAGISNPYIISHIADIIVIGRGEGVINDILNGEIPKNVYNGSQEWKIRQPQKLLSIPGWNEKEVGCKKKCFFCQYSWKYEKPSGSNYQSGFSSKEDFFTYHDWNNSNAVSAIDGLTETTRKVINKNITNSEIIEKIRGISEYKENEFKIKLYMIVGFPWESEQDFYELQKVLKNADFKSNKKLNIWFNSTHFVPMPFTPMQNEKINIYNFRELVLKKYWVKSFFKGHTIKASFMPHFSAPESAIVQSIINRGNPNNLRKLTKILQNKKYQALKARQKIKVLQRDFEEKLYGYTEIKDEEKTPYNLSKAVNAYETKKQKYIT